jgi:hypothetical protein
MLKREYTDETLIPLDVRQHYARDDATGRFVLVVEEPAPPAPPPVRFRSDLKTPADKARFCKEKGYRAYLELPETDAGKITDKAQLNDRTRPDFIKQHGVGAYNALPDSRAMSAAKR